jgi:HSP20 family molecular chaperone IbpA
MDNAVLMEIEKLRRASLASLRDPEPETAEKITVEVRSSEKGMALAYAKTDAQGYFHVDIPKSGGMFYLRLSAPGVNPYQLRVRIKKNGPPELQSKLTRDDLIAKAKLLDLGVKRDWR